MSKDTAESLKSQRIVARTKVTRLGNELMGIWNQKGRAYSDDLVYAINVAENHFTIMQRLQCELDQHKIHDDS